jgi:SGNH hydrolase-like domain, acetyltransferase AlgX
MRNLVLVVSGILLGLALSEGALRVFNPTYPSVYQPDSTLLYRLVPSSRKLYVRLPANGGDRILVKINSLGFRGDELRSNRPVKRIAVYGDSFIEAEFSTLENTFVKRLERDLNETGDSVEVINAGVVGYGPDQEKLSIEESMPRLHPDVVVLAVYAGNDLGDLLRHKIYRLGPDGSLVRNTYHLNRKIERLLRQAAFPTDVWHSDLYRLIRSIMERRSKQPAACRFGSPARHEGPEPLEETLQTADSEYRAFVEQGNNEASNIFCGHYDADVALTPDAPSSRYKVGLAEALIPEIRRGVEAAGTTFVLLIIPSPVDVCDSYEIRVDRAKFPAYAPSHLTDVFDGIARRRGMRYLNLYTPFRAANGCRLYFAHKDDHWNDEGQRLAAELTASFLRTVPQHLMALAGSAPSSPAIP